MLHSDWHDCRPAPSASCSRFPTVVRRRATCSIAARPNLRFYRRAQPITPCEITIGEVNSPELLPKIPSVLHESSAIALEWPRLRDHIAGRTFSPLGRAWILALEPCADLPWIEQQHQRTTEMRAMLLSGGSFEFRGLFDPTLLLDKARIEGSALEGLEVRDLLTVTERVAAWRT